MSGWVLVEDYHASSAHQVFEHCEVPVIVHNLGHYPAASNGHESTHDHPYIAIALGGATHGPGIRTYDRVLITAEGRYAGSGRRALKIWEESVPSTSEPASLIEMAMAHLDEAAQVLRSIDQIFDKAENRVREGFRYQKPFSSQQAYLDACAALGVEALTDEQCGSYGVRFGNFTFPMYPADRIVQMHLARLRHRALQEVREDQQRTAVPRRPAPAKEGQIWEPCEHCGREPVYMPLMVCEKCWPRQNGTPESG